MIANAAENCFWMFRNLERGESLARILLHGHLYNLDNKTPNAEYEDRVVTLTVDKELFSELCAQFVGNKEVMQNFLTWQQENPNSLFCCFKNGRENCKLIRNIICEPIWNGINEHYVWLVNQDSKNLYLMDRYAFYERFITCTTLLKGYLYSSVMRDAYFHIMQLGINVERIYQSINIISYLKSTSKEASKSFENIKFLLEWHSAIECYLTKGYTLDEESCIQFFLHEKTAPYSISVNLENISEALSAIGSLQQEPLPDAIKIALSNMWSALSTIEVSDNAFDGTTPVYENLFDSLNRLNISIENTFYLSGEA